MSLKNLMVGSFILVAILVIFSMAANSAVDKSLQSNNASSSSNAAGDAKAMKAELPHGSASLEDAQKNPSIVKNLIQKLIDAVVKSADEAAGGSKTTVGSSDNSGAMTYEQLLEEYPLTEEEMEQISRYSGDKSPVELIEAYCADSQSPEFQEMISQVKDSYGDDPDSPALLMDMFATMSELCPSQP